MAKALFITGTGTDVGKTFVTGLILKKLKENKTLQENRTILQILRIYLFILCR